MEQQPRTRIAIYLTMLIAIALVFLVKPSFADTLAENAPIAAAIETTNNKTQLLNAQNTEDQTQLDEQQQRQRQRANQLQIEPVSAQGLEHIAFETVLVRAKLDSARIAQAEARQTIAATQDRIRNIEYQLQDITLAAGKTREVKVHLQALQNKLNAYRELLRAQQKYADAVDNSYNIAKRMHDLEQEHNAQIQYLYQAQERLKQEDEFHQKELALQQQQQKWLETLRDLNDDIQALANAPQDNVSTQRILLELKVLQAQEMSNVNHLSLVLERLDFQYSQLGIDHHNKPSVSELNAIQSQLRQMITEGKRVKKLIKQKLKLIGQRQQAATELKASGILTAADYKTSVSLLHSVAQSYDKLRKRVEGQIETFNSQQLMIQASLKNALAKRQALPGLSLAAWASLGHKLMLIPGLSLQALNALKDQVVIAAAKLKTLRFIGIVLLEVVWFCLWYWLRGFLQHRITAMADARESITDNVVYVITELLSQNLAGLFIFAGIVFVVLLSGVSLRSFSPIFTLAIVWFAFKFAIGIARFSLLESVQDASGRDVQFYHRLKWFLLGGAGLTFLTVLSQQLPVGFEVRDFFNRLMMLLIVAVSVLILKNWQVVPALIEPYLDPKRTYIPRLVRSLSFLIPLTIFVTAMIGLVGYVDLAWAISRYEGVFFMVMTGYVLVHGFVHDIFEWLSELFIRRLRNGWLWTQAVLRPLDKIMRFGLFIFAWYILFISYGWDRDSYVVSKLRTIVNYHLIDLKGASITILLIVKFVIAVLILIWAAKWSREFAYRWLFSRQKDLGLRHSLSAFTQYAVVIFSLLIALQVIGLDLTGLSYILGGLAIGVGFGLRDLTKNYISGLMLLIERPVRAGDLVTVGEFEGEVTDISMRSMTVKTWDRMEVLVPNSEMFDKPFTNWTHQDSIVRTVAKIKVSRDENITQIQQIIHKVLSEIPEIVTDPAPQVFLKEIEEVLLELEVRYFINLAQTVHGRASMRSVVLMAIWHALKAEGIRPPHDAQDIFLCGLPHSERPSYGPIENPAAPG